MSCHSENFRHYLPNNNGPCDGGVLEFFGTPNRRDGSISTNHWIIFMYGTPPYVPMLSVSQCLLLQFLKSKVLLVKSLQVWYPKKRFFKSCSTGFPGNRMACNHHIFLFLSHWERLWVPQVGKWGAISIEIQKCHGASITVIPISKKDGGTPCFGENPP